MNRIADPIICCLQQLKTITCTRLFLLLLYGTAPAQSFGNGLNVQYTGTQTFHSVYMLDAVNVVAAGDFTTLLRSFDGGEKWYTRRTPATYSFPSDTYKCLFFVDDTTGYACTQSENILIKTIDGGETWTSSTSLSTATVNDLFFTTIDSGYYVTGTGAIYRTANGGTTWTQVLSTFPLTSLWCTSTTIWAGAGNGTLRKSVDDGQTWTTISFSNSQAIRDLQFADDSLGWILAQNGNVFRTTDAGITWVQMPPPGANLYHLCIVSADTIFATVGNDSLYRSYDRGQTWLRQRVSNGQGVMEVSFDRNSHHGVAVGINGLIIRTTDLGATWTNWYPLNYVSSFNCSSFINASQGWVGTNNQIMNTTNGGVSWNVQLTGAGVINDLQMINANNGWAVGDNGVAFRTTNGGATWNTMTTGVTSDMRGVFFVNATTGWWCGDLGRIYKTTNGGVTWTQQYGLNSTQSIYDLYDIHFINATTGWACGHNNNSSNAGVIVKTTNGGTTWTPVAVGSSGTHLYGLWFTDALNGYTVGNTATLGTNYVLKTTDGGTIWTNYSNPTGLICNDVMFLNATTGYVVGRNATLLKTTDAGLTWTNQVTGFQYDLNAISVINPDTFWVMSNEGFILHNNNCSYSSPLSVTNDGPVCEGDPLTITANVSGSPSFHWFGPSGFTATGNTLFFPQAPDSLMGIFYVALTTNGCEGRYTRDTVVINPLPEIPLVLSADSIHLCYGDTATLSTVAQPHAALTWLYNGQPTTITATTFLTDSAGVYTVVASNGCATFYSPDSSVVIAQPPPVVTIDSLTTVCTATDSLLLNVALPAGGIYSGPGVANNYFYPALAGTGSHTIHYTYAHPVYGCDTTVSSVVLVNASPVNAVLAVQDSIYLCSGDSTLLQFSADTNTTYEWKLNGIPTGIQQPQLYVTQAGSYSVDAFNSCDTLHSDTIHVFVNSPPPVSLAPLPGVCVSSDSVPLTNGSPAGGTYTGPGVSNGYFFPSIAGAGTHVISYSVTDTLTGCDSTASISIPVSASATAPLIAGPDSVWLCAGDSILLSTVPQAAITFSWLLNGTPLGIFADSVFVDQPGVYTVVATGSCDTIASADSTTLIDGTPVCSIDSLPLVCLNGGVVQLSGWPANGIFSGPGITANSFDPLVSGPGSFAIQYTYTDTNGCTGVATDSIHVVVCTGENAVTGAGHFDVYPNPVVQTLLVRYTAGEAYELKMFNAMGALVLHTKNNQPLQEIDLSALPAGYYLLELSAGEVLVRYKIQKVQ